MELQDLIQTHIQQPALTGSSHVRYVIGMEREGHCYCGFSAGIVGLGGWCRQHTRIPRVPRFLHVLCVCFPPCVLPTVLGLYSKPKLSWLPQ